ncbi:hypothetical protein [Actinomadura roseirufa]|uniref:hypothetical protein n=1 Tax=Actinomadura roseirufa TaxID=2094049 RepID=UPI0010419AC7|nr:hypothetical protein [Actinomadura roseirufa]
MSKDGWLGPDACGVKLTQFEHMSQQMTQAAPKLRALADELWRALHGAGLSTAPAMEIKRIAGWADRAASDLRRRTLLVHDLDRQRLAMTICRPDGTYLKVPDRYTDQVAYADGGRAAALFRRAGSGDASARAALRGIRPDDITPMFAKALLESLGPEELLKLPMSLSLKLAGDIAQHSSETDARAADTRAILTLLGRGLALATDPHVKGHLDGDYLVRLRAAGRTSFPPNSAPPHGTAGYQSLATLIAAAGDARFSTEFIDTVGNDMIAYDSGVQRTLGQVPLPDLTGRFDLGDALDPGTGKVTGGERRTDFLAPLLRAAAASGTAASQALLTHRPMGPVTPGPLPAIKVTNLEYLMHDRRVVWAGSDHGAALGTLLRAAAGGHDPESTRLAFAAAKILADDARANVEIKDGNVHIGDKSVFDALTGLSLADALARPHHYDELSGLRPAMATVMVAHLDKIHDLTLLSKFDGRAGSTGMTGEDFDYLLLDLTRDATAYQTLLMGQMAHAKLAIDGTVADHGDLENTIAGEGHLFGHLLEARHQAVGAEEARLAEDLARMRQYVGYGVALIPLEPTLIPGRAAGGPVLAAASTKLSGAMTDWLAKRLADKADPTILAPKTDTEGVERLLNQMIVSSLTSHGRLNGPDLAGRTFATPGPHPKVRPFESLDAQEMERFLQWAGARGDMAKLSEQSMEFVHNGAIKTAGHYRDKDGHSVAPKVQR